MPSTNKNTISIVAALLFGSFFCLNFYLNYSRVNDANFVDLRNRVTGARLMAMNVSPYFFKWDSSKPETLLDPFDLCNIKNNMTTSPPSLLWLMKPLAHLDYNSICQWWIILHYLFFLVIVIPLYASCRSNMGRNLLLVAAALLLLSDHWRESVFKGQSHFILPAILSVCIWLFSTEYRKRFLLAGLLLAVMVWIRPNALLIIPFLFGYKEIKAGQLLMGVFTGGIVLASTGLLLHHERYWFDFYLSCKEWLHNNTSGMKFKLCHFVQYLEGKAITLENIPNPVHWQSEQSNINVFIEKYLHARIGYIYYNIFFLVTYFAALLVTFRKKTRTITDALLAGLLLYWFSEVTTPIMKATYYYVELFVAVLWLTGRYKDLTLAEKILIACSFVFPFLKPLPMNMATAELCMVLALVLYLGRKIVFRKKSRPPVTGESR